MSDLRNLLNAAHKDAYDKALDDIRENLLEPHDDQADILHDQVFGMLIDDPAYGDIEAVELSTIADEAIADAHAAAWELANADLT